MFVGFDAFGKSRVFFVVGVGGELDFFGDVFASIDELGGGASFYDVKGIVERAVVSISGGEEEGVAVGGYFLVVTAARTEFVETFVELNAVTLGRAVADSVDGS